jgi:hypothetical protein
LRARNCEVTYKNAKEIFFEGQLSMATAKVNRLNRVMTLSPKDKRESFLRSDTSNGITVKDIYFLEALGALNSEP